MLVDRKDDQLDILINSESGMVKVGYEGTVDPSECQPILQKMTYCTLHVQTNVTQDPAVLVRMTLQKLFSYPDSLR